jgi:fructose-1,6-bisphosphatase II
MYMRKLAVGPRRAARSTCSSRWARTCRRSPTRSAGVPNDITTIVLDRPRHHDLIEDIRASGARHQADPGRDR